MPGNADHREQSERTQTDESLRVERERSDQAVEDWLSTINAAADAVINRARARAREVLARARQRADAVLSSSSASRDQQAKHERVVADQVLKAEQLDADKNLSAELAAQVARLGPAREDTDSHLETERAHSDKVLATRDEVLGSVSHELRNMLHSMIGFAELIELGMTERTPTEKQVVIQARFIQRAGARMDRLIGDLVDVASIESGVLTMKREILDPTAVVKEALEAFEEQATASGISLVSALATPVSLALFDPARVLQVLVNLLSNALKFTPKAGKVGVQVGRVGDEVRFAVSDTGIGIHADKLETVFERFWQVAQNDRRGAGLGLYISKRIVLAHGGRIWAESKRDAGSTFYFTVPCADSPSVVS